MAETGGIGPEDYRQAAWLASQFEQRWRYDHTEGRWHHWDGKRWAPDQTNAVNFAVRGVALEALSMGSMGDAEQKRLYSLLNLQPQKRALEALATFPGYGTNGDDWDSDPFLLGVENGIVDLRTNTLIGSPPPTMLVTKTTAVAFHPISAFREAAERAPVFMTFMDDITSEDPDMVAFLLLWFGASLFGFTPEQRFLLMTGIGRNGKGALKNAIIHAVGEYGAQYDANLYMRSKFGAARSDQARADLMAIKGKRITFFSEPEGNRFNEELLKAHTGGDRITARALHSNNVQSWDPTHSITFLVNNAPEVEDLGPSMAARVMVADFRERYDGEKEDKKLYGKLKAEAQGILAILCWAAQAWHASWSESGEGITLPERVVEQSKQFMERNDPIANWLNERAEFGQNLHQSSQLAYESYLNWHSRTGQQDEAMSMTKWATFMMKKGFTKQKTETGMKWRGFSLLGAMALADRGLLDEDEEP
jgi:putative DNA primase/helicase